MRNTRHNTLAMHRFQLRRQGKVKPQLVIGGLLFFLVIAVALPRLNLSGKTLVITDENDDKWTLRRTSHRSRPVKSNATSQPGPPLLVDTDVSIRGRNVTVGMTVRGQAGEEYELSARKNGKRQALPTIDIFDVSGKHLHSAKFEYG